jgi:tripartite-type tricarboxylate transporter receptor subunit TctC
MLRAARMVAVLAMAAAAAVTGARADGYPSKPVKVIVPFAAGGGTDIFARVWGAAGAIGTKAAIKATPDGYTLVMGVASTIAINPHTMGDIGYKPLTELTPISLIAYTPWIMVASSQLPFDRVDGLIDYDKKNPGKLTFASWTATGEIGRKLFALRAGVQIQPVPYDGAVAAMNDLVAGRASVAMLELGSAVPFIEAGKVKPLAVTGPSRTDLIKDLPAIAEAGVKDMDVNSWVALFAPAGTPDAVVAKLNAETSKILAKPDVKARLAKLGADVYLWSPAETAKFVREQSQIWAGVIGEVGAKK